MRKLNGVADADWHTVTFTVNDEEYPVDVPAGASLAVEQQAALAAFLGLRRGVWREMMTIGTVLQA